MNHEETLLQLVAAVGTRISKAEVVRVQVLVILEYLQAVDLDLRLMAGPRDLLTLDPAIVILEVGQLFDEAPQTQ